MVDTAAAADNNKNNKKKSNDCWVRTNYWLILAKFVQPANNKAPTNDRMIDRPLATLYCTVLYVSNVVCNRTVEQ